MTEFENYRLLKILDGALKVRFMSGLLWLVINDPSQVWFVFTLQGAQYQ